MDRLRSVLAALGDDKDKLVVDLSCRRKDDKWFVAINKWQTITETEITQGSRSNFSPFPLLTVQCRDDRHV